MTDKIRFKAIAFVALLIGLVGIFSSVYGLIVTSSEFYHWIFLFIFLLNVANVIVNTLYIVKE